MKKFLAAILAALTMFSVFSFTACSSADKLADIVVQTLSEGTGSVEVSSYVKQSVKTLSERVEEGSVTNHTENSTEQENSISEKINLAVGEYDIEHKASSRYGSSYEYFFGRGGYDFTYSSPDKVEDFSKKYLDNGENSAADLEATLELLPFAKKTGALKAGGSKLTVDLNVMLHRVVSDLNGVFKRLNGNVTLGGVFEDDKIKGYFDDETYERLSDLLKSRDVYTEVKNLIYRMTGGAVQLPWADCLAQIDLTEFAKEFREITKKVTKKKFVISATEIDHEDEANSTPFGTYYEGKFDFNLTDAKLVFTVKDGAVTAHKATAKLSIAGAETMKRDDVVTKQSQNITFDLSEDATYSKEECALIDLNKARVMYRYEAIPDGNNIYYITNNNAPNEFYGVLVDGGFDFNLQIYVDKNMQPTNVVGSGLNITSSYNKTDRSLTLGGGNFSQPTTIYLDFVYDTNLTVYGYQNAADRDARRLCSLSGSYDIFGDEAYYPVYMNLYSYSRNLYRADTTVWNGQITELIVKDYVYHSSSIYSAAEGKLTVTMKDGEGKLQTIILYIGVAEENGREVKMGLYRNRDDIGTDKYEKYFTLYYTTITKSMTLEELIKGDFK